MKRVMREYGWVLMVIFFMVMIAVALKIVDEPEKIGAKENPFAIPQEVIDAAEECGEEFHICPELLEAIAWHESRYVPTAVNKYGTCFGLMQVKHSAHSGRMKKLGATDLFDLRSNMRVAADYLLELAEEYEDMGMVLMTYHGESDAVWKYENGILSDYAQGILDLTEELEYQHGKKEIEKVAHFGFELMWENGVG